MDPFTTRRAAEIAMKAWSHDARLCGYGPYTVHCYVLATPEQQSTEP
jgi:hypothetical protein